MAKGLRGTSPGLAARGSVLVLFISLVAATADPATAITGAATPVWPGQATLNASINPNGQSANYWFEHGPTTNYGSTTPISTLASGINFVAVSNLVTGLPRGLPYHFRVVASNSASQIAGVDTNFTVPAGPTAPSGTTGGGEPFDIRQPSLELNYIICTNGSYPSSSGSVLPPFLGEVRLFAGDFAPAGWEFCQGQLLSTTTSEALYEVIGTTYGGDGITTFGLPDLRARTAVGAGPGPGVVVVDHWPIQRRGAGDFDCGTDSRPHAFAPASRHCNRIGRRRTQARINVQPSLGLSYLVALSGQYPLSGGQVVFERFQGQIMLFAGSYSTGGSSFASGQLLSINHTNVVFVGGNQLWWRWPNDVRASRSPEPGSPGNRSGTGQRVVAGPANGCRDRGDDGGANAGSPAHGAFPRNHDWIHR